VVEGVDGFFLSLSLSLEEKGEERERQRRNHPELRSYALKLMSYSLQPLDVTCDH